ncbi:MAG: HD-GYP domain-containing protein [Defluviitaleaceae bacterium]|nr:HD-GYP domain-containing protein [Defluviitaleaceae bacterium]
MADRAKIRMRLDDVYIGMTLAEAVYITLGGNNMMVARKDAIVDAVTMSQLKKFEVAWVYTYATYGSSASAAPVPDEDLNEKPTVKPWTTPGMIKPALEKDVCTAALDSIRDLFTALQSTGEDVNLKTTYSTVSNFNQALYRLVPEVLRHSSDLHIQNLKVIEDLPYHHSLSVAILSIATGRVLGFDVARLLKLARCAILHDVGKPYVPLSITGKKGKLSPEEYAIMKEHPVIGALNLKRKGFGDLELWNGIMFHHEKVDGSGYPKGLTDKEIPIFSKIIAVADTYEAITSHRPYRPPMNPADAFDLVSSEVGKSFDFDIVEAFSKHLTFYPVGSAVGLSDGRVGVVVNCDNVRRPTIEILSTDEMVDLADIKNLSLAITDIISAS